MAALSNVLSIAHLTLLAGFLSVTFLLLLVSVMNRLRLRNTLLTWRSGPLFGIPVRPSLFLILLAIGVVYVQAAGRPVNTPILLGYIAAGGFWFMASWIGNAVFITEHGIVAKPSSSGATVAWGQVVDYFETGRNSRNTYVFLYVDEQGIRRRIDVTPPKSYAKRFRQIVAFCLDTRFSSGTERVYGKTALER